MPKKRKNRGRHKGDKGKESVVYCDNCGRRVPRSKAVRVTVPYSPVPGDLAKDLEKQGALITRYYVTKTYCVNCAIYMGILKVRSESERKTEKRPVARTPTVPRTTPSNAPSTQDQTQQSNTQKS
ncbi:MAG: 30S ribosomal protein S26e [Thermocladium sp.]|jgi:Ribosomal protein S26